MKPHPSIPEPPARAGFTLIEVLLALALGVMLLTGAIAFMSNMSKLYLIERSAPQPYAHADNLLRFLESTLNRAKPFDARSQSNSNPTNNNQENNSGIINTGTTPSSNNNTSNTALSWQMLPDAPPTDDPLLAFRFNEPLAPLEYEPVPLHERMCFIDFEKGVGLVMLWYPAHADEPPEETLRRTLLSPHVMEMSYLYYNKETEHWDTLDSFLDDSKVHPLPQLIEMTVAVGDDKTRKIIINLPPLGTNSYPIY